MTAVHFLHDLLDDDFCAYAEQLLDLEFNIRREIDIRLAGKVSPDDPGIEALRWVLEAMA